VDGPGADRAALRRHLLHFTHLVQPEPFLACFISLSLWCLIEARLASIPEEAAPWYFRFWIFLALGTMSKGLHGALWPLATVGLTALFVPGSRQWLRPVLSLRGPSIARSPPNLGEAIVACEALPNTASSLLYYVNVPVHWVNAPFNNQYAQRVLGLGRDYYWDDATFQQVWHSASPVYPIIEQDRLAHWKPLLTPGLRIVKSSGNRLVLCNR
jgi:hypothetical protein